MHLYEVLRAVKTRSRESRLPGAGRRGNERMCDGDRASDVRDDRVVGVDGGVWHIINIFNPLNCT